MRYRQLCALLTLSILIAPVLAAEPPARVLLVTHGGGFIHDSVVMAEKVLKEQGAKHGFQVTCYRFTADPDARIKVKRKVDGKEVEMETTALEDYSARFRQRTGEPVERQHCGR